MVLTKLISITVLVFTGKFTALVMTDNGQNGDATADDGEYTAYIPGAAAGS